MAEKREVLGEFQIESACESCGSTFLAEARDDVGGQPDEHLVKVLEPECPACAELGCKPPPCPTVGCGHELKGRDYEKDGGATCFECVCCDAQFMPRDLRSLLFGRACEEIVRAAEKAGGYALGGLVLRRARELGVIH